MLSRDVFVVIDAHGIKRELPLPFGICGSRQVLLSIVRQIVGHIKLEERDMDASGDFSYGWVNIVVEGPEPSHTIDTPPKPWSA